MLFLSSSSSFKQTKLTFCSLLGYLCIILAAPISSLYRPYTNAPTGCAFANYCAASGDSSGSRVRKKEAVPRKSSLKVASSSDGSNNNAMSSKSRDGLPLHARFNLPDSPRNGPVNASAAAASSSSPLQQQQRPSPSAMKNAPAPPPRNTRERLVSSQLDIHKWQKKRMEQGDDLGRIY